MKEVLMFVLLMVLIGVLLGIGIRITEWSIRQPDKRIVVCFANELDWVEICKPAGDLLKKNGGEK